MTASAPLSRVRLLDGPCKQAMLANAKYVLSLEPDRLLAMFFVQQGLEPKGEAYGGWESGGLASHTFGHYLSACSLAHVAGAEGPFRERLEYSLAELQTISDASPDNFISGIKRGREMFAEVAAGDIRSKGFDLNGAWAPWYTYHKLMAGLRDAVVLVGLEQALPLLIKTADFVGDVTDPLSGEQMQAMMACEFGGLGEALADVYGLTGDPRYLTLARRFDHTPITDALAVGEDPLPQTHANTQIPKALAEAVQYELVGDARARDIAENFWDHVVNHHSYSIAAHSDGEYFGPRDTLADRLSPHSAEICNSYNMLKLASHLFCWEPRSSIGQFCETNIYNHVLASQNTVDGMMCYYMPLNAGTKRSFSTPEDSFWCCVGTGIENHFRYGENIYFTDEATLYVNLYIASTLDWSDRGVKLSLDTTLPTPGATNLTLQLEQPQELTLKLRKPTWVDDRFCVTVNGQAVDATDDDGYVTLTRTWNDGDTVSLDMPFSLRTLPMPDRPSRLSVAYGPVVLAGDFGSDAAPSPIPVIVSDSSDPSDWMECIDETACRFRTTGGAGQPEEFELAPFYSLTTHFAMLYPDVYTTDAWSKYETEYKAEQLRLSQLDTRTTDKTVLGEMQPERDHDYDGSDTVRVSYHADQPCRYAKRAGWFSVKMTLDPSDEMELAVTYFGSDRDCEPFEILFEGSTLCAETLSDIPAEEYHEKVYPLPIGWTTGRFKGEIKFVFDALLCPHIYNIRVMRATK